MAKVASFEQRLLADTYTPHSVPTLNAIAQELTSAIEHADQESQQVGSLTHCLVKRTASVCKLDYQGQ